MGLKGEYFPLEIKGIVFVCFLFLEVGTMAAKFGNGSKVKHPVVGSHSAGTGTVVSSREEDGKVLYKVKCDHSGQVIDSDIAEADLAAA